MHLESDLMGFGELGKQSTKDAPAKIAVRGKKPQGYLGRVFARADENFFLHSFGGQGDIIDIVDDCPGTVLGRQRNRVQNGSVDGDGVVEGVGDSASPAGTVSSVISTVSDGEGEGVASASVF